ncbi:uncharacterized protein JN550_005402 [Neoarthrinium moseri]|uniref:uncharacterized protein n=1 Tax=Neoarthrinium moseri TaxID=1658444 RepID=UPI001FDAFDF4|nr:uncharacterized protein JN550_005402 [Neoarthrinium moseri]KAI1870474.1 hypothetical protein JN550_005402 [Neoarthrinium moseri]
MTCADSTLATSQASALWDFGQLPETNTDVEFHSSFFDTLSDHTPYDGSSEAALQGTSISSAAASESPQDEEDSASTKVTHRKCGPERKRSRIEKGDEKMHSLELRRRRNRIAAVKFRQKSNAKMEDLVQRSRHLQSDNVILHSVVSELRSQLLEMKTEVLKHGGCDFPPIQKYIREAANSL